LKGNDIYLVYPCHQAWRDLRLWMEERPPIWRAAVNILKK